MQRPNPSEEIERLKYPIGRFSYRADSSRERMIRQYGLFPDGLEAAVKDLTSGQLDTPYRPGGWTVRQVVHHLPESHMNAYVRFKMTLTEDAHEAMVANEAAWAELTDSRVGPIKPSLRLFRALQVRWMAAMKATSSKDWERTLSHPEMGTVSLDYLGHVYEWHARHHIAHITSLRERMKW